MKVVLVTPNYHQHRGNTVTVQRIARKLAAHNVETEVVSISENYEENPTILPKGDIIHGFNAYHFFKFKENLETPIKSYVVTLTGTDLNYDLFNQQKRSDVIQSVTGAQAVHVFNHPAKEIILKEVPEVSEKIYVIEQDINNFKEIPFPIPKEDQTFLFVLPAGIRPVKNVPFAIETLEKLHRNYSHLRLLLVGPVLDEAEGKLVHELVKKNEEWVQYIGEVPYKTMGSLYKIADALLNTSHSEGQSTAIMEGMAFGLPVLVSHNDGNLSLVEHGKTGLVYQNESDFLQYAEAILINQDKRTKLGQYAKSYITNHHANSKEASDLLGIYHQILKRGDKGVK